MGEATNEQELSVPTLSGPSRGVLLYDLKRAETGGGGHYSLGDVASIVTPAAQHAYALVVTPRLGSERAHRCRIRLSLFVSRGAIGVGVLTRDGSRFYQEVNLSSASTWQVCEVITPAPGNIGNLVIRNHCGSGASQARATIVDIEELSEDFIESRASLQERAAFLFDDSVSKMRELYDIVTGDDVAISLSMPLASLGESLDGILLAAGLTAVDRDPLPLASMLTKLGDSEFITLAESLAVVLPLERAPGWRFNSFETSRDLATHVRNAVWAAARQRNLQRPIVVPWHDQSRLSLWLDNDISHTFYPTGRFEPNEFALLSNVLKPGMVFVDGGANEGFYTIFAAARVGPEGRVYAVEPSRRELTRLRQNIALNQALNVDVVEAALSEVSGTAELVIADPEHAGQNTFGRFMYAGVAEAGRCIVPTVRLDDLIVQLGTASADVIKLDLEGAEYHALMGAPRILAEMRPLLLVEAADAALRQQGSSRAALIDLLDAAGYRLLTIDAQTGRTIEADSYSGELSDNLVAVHTERSWGLLS